MNQSQLTFDERVTNAYEWLKEEPSRTLNQAAMRYKISNNALAIHLKQRYAYSAKQALLDREQKRFDELCQLWPKIKKDLDTTELRALEIMRKYGYGQHSLNRLTVHFKYDIDKRANRIRQAKRARTLGHDKKPVERVKLVHSLPLKELWKAVA